MSAPDYDPTDYDQALAAAKDALSIADISKDAALGRRLVQTAVGETYRPYAAAYRWLGANPKWLEETSRASFRGSVLSLPQLANEQASEDARLGLDVPEHLKVASGSSVPGPVFTSWQ